MKIPAWKHTAQLLLLSILYIATGKLGLMLAVPPGYATIIWPASGIAVGMLLVYGQGLWPGILIGSFILNCHVSEAVTPEGVFVTHKVMAAIGIACGSTMQALVGRMLAARFVGLPLAFKRGRDILALLLMTGPFACLIAATVGVGSLVFSGVMPIEKMTDNWLTWWLGDMFGVFVFMPLVLLSARGTRSMTWRGDTIGRVPLLAIASLVVPLGLTFYGWKITSENVYQDAMSRFNAMALESEKALLSRVNAYNYAILGGKGFLQGSEYVSRQEWREYTRAINVKSNFPGINGIGIILDVKPDNLDTFIKETRDDGYPDFRVHPETVDRPYYVIKYIEPESINAQAIGLNIGFEDNRREAANLARDTGESAITRKIILVQDEEKTPGFLLLHPLYKPGMPTTTVEERRQAFESWVYAPFIAKNFLKDLTQGQGKMLHLHVYDGDDVSESSVIFSDELAENRSARHPSDFRIQKKISVMQTDWTLVWESTSLFETQNRDNSPTYILAGGLLFTGLFGLFLLSVAIRSSEVFEAMAGRRYVVFPAIVFTVSVAGVFYVYDTLKKTEFDYARIAVGQEAKKIEKIIDIQAAEKMLVLQRMAQRWEVAKGTPPDQWRADAKRYVSDLSGLKTVEWIDETYHVRLVEPEKGNEKAIGLNIVFDEQRERALKGAAEKSVMTLTPPLDLVQGYKAFIAYAPIKIEGRFGGFIAGIFSIDEFFGRIISSEVSGNYQVDLSYEGEVFFKGRGNKKTVDKLAVTKVIALHDKAIKMHIAPVEGFIEDLKTDTPYIILFSGLMISLLLALTVRYVMISRVKSAYLERSNRLNEGILSSASYMIVATDSAGRVILFNNAAEKHLGYKAEEVIGRSTPAIWHDAHEVTERAEELSQELGAPVVPDFDVFAVKPEIEGQETRDWTFIDKNNRRFPVSLTVTPLRDSKENIAGYLGIAEDITERREMDRMKNEFISIVSHELRTPLTSIRGSLGLLEGTMFSDIPEKAMNLIKIAHKNSERLILLINDILDLDKITAGKMRFTLKPEDTASLVYMGVEINAAYAEKHGVTFVAEALPEDLVVNVDADRWQQVFSNLLSNAAKFSPEGGGVAITVEAVERNIRVSVQDKGPGIPVEFRERIFSKFSQADSAMTRQKGGTGLGLNISKEIVTRMGGTIGFDTEVGQGTTFWFEFPDMKHAASEKENVLLAIAYATGSVTDEEV
ncbi:MAG: CHASE domain-containing protein, partial [Alphaproteobacteria bacterium]|nr:CHASE domain-containing protein [Alphaproteobacteria bacterium]